MWQIKNIKIKNICTLKDVAYDFRGGVTTLVFGRNLDNEGQQNNGSGKSALTEAIVFGLTGAPLRNVKNDELINNDEQEAYIGIGLENPSLDSTVWIERTLKRKGSPTVRVTLVRNGEIVEDGTTVKSGIEEYNRYILELIGLSREDIYNCFVLSKHKYQDFLSAPDREKKEIINRFSHANLVDQSIESVKSDLEQLNSDLERVGMQLSGVEGKISATEEQIETEQANAEQRERTREQKMERLKDEIDEQQRLIETCESSIEEHHCFTDQLKKAAEVLEDIEQHIGDSFENVMYRIEHEFAPIIVMDCHLEQARKEREQHTNTLNLLHDEMSRLEEADVRLKAAWEKTKTEVAELDQLYERFDADKQEEEKRYHQQADKLIAQSKQTGLQIKHSLEELAELNRQRINLSAALKESIRCPFCGKHFILNDENFDTEQAQSELDKVYDLIAKTERETEQMREEKAELDKTLGVLGQKYAHWLDEYEQDLYRVARGRKRACDSAKELVDENTRAMKRCVENHQRTQEKLMDVARNLVDDLFDRMENDLKRAEQDIRLLKNEIASHNGIISAKQKLLEELQQSGDEGIMESLKQSLKRYKKQRMDVSREHGELTKQADTLKGQELTFASFKTYLANSRIEALNSITNRFLEEIGSDMRVKMNGYTTLKSGAVREKISVSLLRDGTDVGSFSKFSEGEKARIQLATILAMHSLTNDNAEDGKGLDLLVLDEILAAVDEEGLDCILKSLNGLRMTSMVISHGKTAEAYPHRLVVTKHNGVSTLE